MQRKPSFSGGARGRDVVIRAATLTKRTEQRDLFGLLGLTIGIVLPVVAAILYPVYMHQMQPAWAEWTRLMEFPFVAGEILIIMVALKKGYRDALVWQLLPKDVIAALGLLLVGLSVSSIFLSKDVPASITFSIVTLIHLRFAAAIFYLARSERDASIESFFPMLTLGLAVLAILTIVKFHTPPPEWTVPGGRIEWPSALPGYINVRYFGSWAGGIASGLMLTLLYGRQRDRWNIASLSYLLAAGLTCWSGTRAAVLAMAAVAVIALIGMRRLPDTRALVRVGGLSALAMAGAIAFAMDDPDFALFVRSDMKSVDALTSMRTLLWHDTFYRWLDSPVFGWGSGSTFWEVNIGWAHTQPHNTFLLFLISWGLVGTLGALWLLGRAIVATFRIAMDDERLLPFAGMTYALLCMSLFAGMLHYPRFVMAIMFGFGILFSARQGRKDDDRRTDGASWS